MKLWGGRFTKEENQLVHNFNESLSFDQKFYHQDIQGSIAHVTMLAKQGIVSEEDRKAIIDGLNSILADIESGKLVFTKEHEDIHSFVEANLIERIGDAGKRLHTGRSRNDQVALDMKLYCRDEIDEIDVGGGLGIAYTAEDKPSSIEDFAEITTSEMIKACKIIPDEELRLALVVLALAYNKNEQANREIFHRQTQEVDSLKEKIKELEKASK